jgi:DEAD/DEAH box helicase domain-containing protein
MLPLTVADHVRETILDYLKTTFHLNDKAVEIALIDFLQDEENGMFKGPYIDLRLPFQKANTELESLLKIAPPFTPYIHQAQAFARLSSQNQQPQPTLITTGTGSGKTECFLFPLLDHCYRLRDIPGIKGIILYPMNALASDQAIRLAKEINGNKQLQGNIRAGLYVGGQAATAHKQMGPDFLIDDRETLRNNPPDILLTNFKMLDFLLIRPEDRPLWRNNQSDTLQYLILDELHTFDGAQGSDVASLIRRLKARLNIKNGFLCPVGTSATVAGGSGNASEQLTTFASQIFAEPFTADAVITETRQSLTSFLDTNFDLDTGPQSDLPNAALSQLMAEPGEAPESYLNRQMTLWFGEKFTPLELGHKLRQHGFLRSVLRATLNESGQAQGVLSLKELSQRVERLDSQFDGLSQQGQALVIQSFLGLIAHARYQDTSSMHNREEPFLTLQTQIWVREMSRLMREVTSPEQAPAFFWRDDRSHDLAPFGLPAYVCRECGHTGWLSSMQKGDQHLARDTKVIYRNYFGKTANVIYVYPEKSQLTYQDYIDPQTLKVVDSGQDEQGRSMLPVVIHSRKSKNSQNPRDLQRCPICENDQSLTILGRQAASLLSVAIGYLFTSPLNNDKKLLAFTDSVQDASHRAAFFGQRTYRFSLRTALQSLLEAEPTGEIRLTEFTSRLIPFLQQRLESQLEERLKGSAEQKLAATLIPPDLKDLPAYRRFIDDAPIGSIPEALAKIIEKRVSWEVTMEYGFNARLGRSLEVVGSSAAMIDPSILNNAAMRLHTILSEEFNLLSQLEVGEVRQFLLGLLDRTRTRGGVFHPLLNRYIESNGSWYLLSRKQNQLLSPFYKSSPRFPRFLADSSSKTFDTYTTIGSAQTWFVEWARKSLSADLGLAEINEGYRYTMQTLLQADILISRQQSGKRTYAIRPQVLTITRQVTRLDCDQCGDSHTIAQSELDNWLNTPCTSYRCVGHLTSIQEADQTYYHNLYQNGQIERIYSAEHTGLLPREEREETERLFKNRPTMDAPNMLTATPTLEMGIDVGDLSATLACSVPPRPANYLQRIGRAGRKTGNAFILALANARDHDLYFFTEPKMMLAGEIIPPGCFLDAPEMLQRQFFAFALDSWTADNPEVRALPHNVKRMMTAHKKGEFPANFLNWFKINQAEITPRFLNLFEDELSEENRAVLHRYGNGASLVNQIELSLDDVIERKTEIRKNIRTLRDDQKKIEAAPAQYDQPDLDIEEIRQEIRMLNRSIHNQDEKYVLNFFTDASLLPNYAFPEPGIELKAIISGFDQASPDGGEQGPGYQVYEFQRAAAQGIRELAPFNTFYAFGRKMQIGRVDTKHRSAALEPWQFCPNCSMMSPVSKIHHTLNCPACGSQQWSDNGQQHKMLSMRAVESRVTQQESRAGDEGDERDREAYETAIYFEVDTEQSAGGWLIPNAPFGFEILNQLTLREINFGLREGFGSKRIVASEEVQETGYRVCPGCGEVEDMRAKDGTPERANHTRTCPDYRRLLKSKTEIPWESLYLYRELKSEGLRLLLPVSDALSQDRLESFKAALQLGLRLYFGGAPDHLQMGFHIEVDQSGTRRRFLMLYDTVPGGTSYLRDLGKPVELRRMLELAYGHVQRCECQRQEGKRACHRCLYSPHTGSDRDFISRTAALELIGRILADWDTLEETTSLGMADISSVIESELEMRFIHTLQDLATQRPGWQCRSLISKGKEVFDLVTNSGVWRIEPQVSLGQVQGVDVSSRPDFLITPKNSGICKPIALFLDGFRYHVQPNQPESPLADDLYKRRAIIDSGNYIVWSISWDDLDLFLGKKTADLSPLFPTSIDLIEKQIRRKAEFKLSTSLLKQNGFTQLISFLDDPKITDWEYFAKVSAAFAIASGRPAISIESMDKTVQQMRSAPQQPEIAFEDVDTGSAKYNFYEKGALQVLLATPDGKTLQAVMRLNDRHLNRQQESFAASWRRFLHHLNLWQFLPGFEPITSSSVEYLESTAKQVPATEAGEDQSGNTNQDVQDAKDEALVASWQDVVNKMVLPEVRPLLPLIGLLPEPEVGFELLDGAERIIGAAELAWVDKKVALLLAEQLIDRPAFEKAGWMIVSFSETDPLKGAERLNHYLSN